LRWLVEMKRDIIAIPKTGSRIGWVDKSSESFFLWIGLHTRFLVGRIIFFRSLDTVVRMDKPGDCIREQLGRSKVEKFFQVILNSQCLWLDLCDSSMLLVDYLIIFYTFLGEKTLLEKVVLDSERHMIL
jgi:hypothetical protein